MKNYKQKLAYIMLGGILMLMGMIASSVLMPNLFAERASLGDIECTSLKVVTPEGTPGIILNPCMDSMQVNEKSAQDMLELFTVGAVFIGVNKHGGRVAVTGSDKHGGVNAVMADGRAELLLADKHGLLPLDTTIFNEED